MLRAIKLGIFGLVDDAHAACRRASRGSCSGRQTLPIIARLSIHRPQIQIVPGKCLLDHFFQRHEMIGIVRRSRFCPGAVPRCSYIGSTAISQGKMTSYFPLSINVGMCTRGA